MYQINFIEEKLGAIEAKSGQNLLALLQGNDIKVNAVCNGKKYCGSCKIKILAGNYQLTESEKKLLTKKELRNGVRLACCQQVEDNLTLEIFKQKEFKILTTAKEGSTSLKPLITAQRINLANESKIDDLLAMIYRASGCKEVDERAILDLNSLALKQEVKILRQGEKIVALSNDLKKAIYGLAIDIGTTTIAIYLIDLSSGEEIDNYSLHNPQYKFGADVISRIEYGLNNKANLANLQKVLLSEINHKINDLTRRNKIKKDDIYLTTLVGNTVMIYTLLNLDLSGIAKSPYQLLFSSDLELVADRFNLAINQRGVIKIPPLISAYVGADIIANLLAVRIDKQAEWVLIIDIGTNGEIVLAKENDIFACSTAAGPAFEGANISFGQAAIAGAISNYKIKDNGIEYNTIAEKKATGICGSGLIDIIAELYKYGFIDSTGAFIKRDKLESWQQERMIEQKQLAYVVLSQMEGATQDILLTQKDIREFQLAKGAILAGINLLLEHVEINKEQIKKVYLSGGFGNYINLDNAYLLNLLPKEFKSRLELLGNGAAQGAKDYLKNQDLATIAREIREKTEYLDLARVDNFQQEFMQALNFIEGVKK